MHRIQVTTQTEAAIIEAERRASAIATVLAADVLDHGGVDSETACWAIQMSDQVARWCEIARWAA